MDRNEGLAAVTDDGIIEMRVAPSFDAFFLQEHDRLYRALYFVTGDADDAEDVVQDAFVRLWERWGELGHVDDLTAYLFRTAMNGFRMRLRRAKVAARHAVSPSVDPDAFYEIELREDTRRLLASLPLQQRAALVLTEIFGYDSALAAEILGVRPSTIRVWAHRGRTTLRGT
jgi:RNA polymerase sigma factor (sigma-70 family)